MPNAEPQKKSPPEHIQIVGDGPDESKGKTNSDKTLYYLLDSIPSEEWRRAFGRVWDSNQIAKSADEDIFIEDQDGQCFLVWKSSFGYSLSGGVPTEKLQNAVQRANTARHTPMNITPEPPQTAQ